VLVEGHVRLTLYALRPDAVPAEVPALLGTSSRMERWALY
jgi:hypothetical protein